MATRSIIAGLVLFVVTFGASEGWWSPGLEWAAVAGLLVGSGLVDIIARRQVARALHETNPWRHRRTDAVPDLPRQRVVPRPPPSSN